MNKRYIKVIAAVAGIALSAAAAAPFMPDYAFAKRLPAGQETTMLAQPLAAAGEQAASAAVLTEPDRDKKTVEAEADVAAPDGKSVRVEVASEKPAKPVAVDEQETKTLQAQADAGHKQWLLNPVDVVRKNASAYGFDANADSFSLMNQSKAGYHRVLVKHDKRYYIVTLTQRAGHGSKGIWQVQSIQEVRVIEKDQPDVGRGIVGLNYAKVLVWQQNVDAGREQWRLDPLAVAREEGKAYGFTAGDSFTIIKRYASTSLARHGEIHVRVNHDGRDYTMILVRPFGSDDGAIWTVYRVSGMGSGDEQPNNAGKVLFQSEKYTDWQWFKKQYLNDMAFATIVDYNAQLKQDSRIPEFVLSKAKDIDYSQKVVLFAYLGTAPGGGYGIGIEKVSMRNNVMTVQVRTRSPRPGQPVTMMIAHPADFVVIDRSAVDIWGGVTIKFIDQDDNELSTNRIVISHR